MQLRFESTLTLESYLSQEAWRSATLCACPLHPKSDCGYARHSIYWRKYPQPLPIARYYCREGHTTFSLLPDFLSSRLPGTLAEVEHVAAVAEQAPSLEAAANEVRRADAAYAVSLESAKRWVLRRKRMFAITLVAVVGIFADRLAEVRTVVQLRERLGAAPALVALREMAAVHLPSLPRPLGFGPGARVRQRPSDSIQQQMGPEPPTRAR